MLKGDLQMRLGLHVGYWGLGFTAEQQLEVVREALRLLQEQDQLRELRLEELRKFVAVGVEQADRGQLAPLDVDATLARVRSRKGKVREGI